MPARGAAVGNGKLVPLGVNGKKLAALICDTLLPIPGDDGSVLAYAEANELILYIELEKEPFRTGLPVELGAELVDLL
jgi:hypothetical protein